MLRIQPILSDNYAQVMKNLSDRHSMDVALVCNQLSLATLFYPVHLGVNKINVLSDVNFLFDEERCIGLCGIAKVPLRSMDGFTYELVFADFDLTSENLFFFIRRQLETLFKKYQPFFITVLIPQAAHDKMLQVCRQSSMICDREEIQVYLRAKNLFIPACRYLITRHQFLAVDLGNKSA